MRNRAGREVGEKEMEDRIKVEGSDWRGGSGLERI